MPGHFFNPPPPPGGGWVPRRGKFFQCKMRRRRDFLKIPCFWDLFSWVGVSPAGPLPPGDGGQNPGGRLSLSVCVSAIFTLVYQVYHQKKTCVSSKKYCVSPKKYCVSLCIAKKALWGVYWAKHLRRRQAAPGGANFFLVLGGVPAPGGANFFTFFFLPMLLL